jgi:hypothetical protein
MNIAAHIPPDWIDLIDPDCPFLGLGLDVATTTGKKSNPSALALTQRVGMFYPLRLLIYWKSRDPEVGYEIVKHVVSHIPHGLKVRKMNIDATSERYYAVTIRRRLASLVLVKLINSSNTTTFKGEEMSTKSYLGNLAVNIIEDGFSMLPNEPYVKTDFRLVNRDRGSFVTEVDNEGRHGDGFDAYKLSLDAIISKGGPVIAAGAQVGTYGTPGKSRDRLPMRAEDYIRDSEKRGMLL